MWRCKASLVGAKGIFGCDGVKHHLWWAKIQLSYIWRIGPLLPYHIYLHHLCATCTASQQTTRADAIVSGTSSPLPQWCQECDLYKYSPQSFLTNHSKIGKSITTCQSMVGQYGFDISRRKYLNQLFWNYMYMNISGVLEVPAALIHIQGV